MTELYREARGTEQPPPVATGGPVERLLARVYELVFAPLDRGIRRFARPAYIDRFTVTVLANLGLSTQLAVLGVCLALDAPEAYLWIVLGVRCSSSRRSSSARSCGRALRSDGAAKRRARWPFIEAAASEQR